MATSGVAPSPAQILGNITGTPPVVIKGTVLICNLSCQYSFNLLDNISGEPVVTPLAAAGGTGTGTGAVWVTFSSPMGSFKAESSGMVYTVSGILLMAPSYNQIIVGQKSAAEMIFVAVNGDNTLYVSVHLQQSASVNEAAGAAYKYFEKLAGYLEGSSGVAGKIATSDLGDLLPDNDNYYTFENPTDQTQQWVIFQKKLVAPSSLFTGLITALGLSQSGYNGLLGTPVKSNPTGLILYFHGSNAAKVARIGDGTSVPVGGTGAGSSAAGCAVQGVPGGTVVAPSDSGAGGSGTGTGGDGGGPPPAQCPAGLPPPAPPLTQGQEGVQPQYRMSAGEMAGYILTVIGATFAAMFLLYHGWAFLYKYCWFCASDLQNIVTGAVGAGDGRMELYRIVLGFLAAAYAVFYVIICWIGFSQELNVWKTIFVIISYLVLVPLALLIVWWVAWCRTHLRGSASGAVTGPEPAENVTPIVSDEDEPVPWSPETVGRIPRGTVPTAATTAAPHSSGVGVAFPTTRTEVERLVGSIDNMIRELRTITGRDPSNPAAGVGVMTGGKKGAFDKLVGKLEQLRDELLQQANPDLTKISEEVAKIAVKVKDFSDAKAKIGDLQLKSKITEIEGKVTATSNLIADPAKKQKFINNWKSIIKEMRDDLDDVSEMREITGVQQFIERNMSKIANDTEKIKNQRKSVKKTIYKQQLTNSIKKFFAQRDEFTIGKKKIRENIAGFDQNPNAKENPTKIGAYLDYLRTNLYNANKLYDDFLTTRSDIVTLKDVIGTEVDGSFGENIDGQLEDLNLAIVTMRNTLIDEIDKAEKLLDNSINCPEIINLENELKILYGKNSDLINNISEFNETLDTIKRDLDILTEMENNVHGVRPYEMNVNKTTDANTVYNRLVKNQKRYNAGMPEIISRCNTVFFEYERIKSRLDAINYSAQDCKIKLEIDMWIEKFGRLKAKYNEVNSKYIDNRYVYGNIHRSNELIQNILTQSDIDNVMIDPIIDGEMRTIFAEIMNATKKSDEYLHDSPSSRNLEELMRKINGQIAAPTENFAEIGAEFTEYRDKIVDMKNKMNGLRIDKIEDKVAKISDLAANPKNASRTLWQNIRHNLNNLVYVKNKFEELCKKLEDLTILYDNSLRYLQIKRVIPRIFSELENINIDDINQKRSVMVTDTNEYPKAAREMEDKIKLLDSINIKIERLKSRIVEIVRLINMSNVTIEIIENLINKFTILEKEVNKLLADCLKKKEELEKYTQINTDRFVFETKNYKNLTNKLDNLLAEINTTLDRRLDPNIVVNNLYILNSNIDIYKEWRDLIDRNITNCREILQQLDLVKDVYRINYIRTGIDTSKILELISEQKQIYEERLNRYIERNTQWVAQQNLILTTLQNKWDEYKPLMEARLEIDIEKNEFIEYKRGYDSLQENEKYPLIVIIIKDFSKILESTDSDVVRKFGYLWNYFKLILDIINANDDRKSLEFMSVLDNRGSIFGEENIFRELSTTNSDDYVSQLMEIFDKFKTFVGIDAYNNLQTEVNSTAAVIGSAAGPANDS